MNRMNKFLTLLMLAALLISACQPLAVQPVTQQDKAAVMDVMDQFFEAYRVYDMDKMLSLQTDDVVWTWIDPGKNFTDFGPEGKMVGTGKDEVRAMFDFDRGGAGFSGYMVWSEVQGNRVIATELWESDWTHEIDAPLITKSTYTLRDDKIATWVWTVSPESSWRFMNTPNALEANRQLMASINEEIWNQGSLDLIDTRYATDYVRHEAGYPAELAGAAGLKQFIQNLRAGFPDWNCTIEEMVAAGDKVAVRYLCQGTHTGEWNGILPTGNSVTLSDTIIHKIVDGKVVEDWSTYDSLSFMQQLGFELMPAQK